MLRSCIDPYKFSAVASRLVSSVYDCLVFRVPNTIPSRVKDTEKMETGKKSSFFIRLAKTGKIRPSHIYLNTSNKKGLPLDCST